MAGICTASVSPRNCGHRDVTVTLDGVVYVLATSDAEASIALTATETEQFLRFGLRYLRSKGVTLANVLNRVVIGEEATNVKQYDLIAPGGTVTKTNIGSVYVNVLPGANGERILVDFTGCTQFRVVLTVNLIGTGAFGARVIRDGDSVVLYENAAIAQTGERELDTDWQTIPSGFDGLTLLRLQMKSVTALDDPVVRRCTVLVR